MLVAPKRLASACKIQGFFPFVPQGQNDDGSRPISSKTVALSQEFAAYGVEDAVEELDAFGSGVAAGDFEGFVDDYRGGGFGEAEHFGYGGAEEVAVNHGHALDAPVLGVLLDESIDLFVLRGGEAVKIVGEASGFEVDIVAGGPEEGLDFVRFLFAQVALKEHLHGEFAGLAACSH